MANSLFASYKGVVLGDSALTPSPFAKPNLEGGDQRCFFVDTSVDVPNANSDQSLANIASGARVPTTPVALTGESLTVTANTWTYDADDVVFTSVAGSSAERIIIYEHNATEANAPLIVLFDTFVSGMPITPTGGNILLQWHLWGIFSW